MAPKYVESEEGVRSFFEFLRHSVAQWIPDRAERGKRFSGVEMAESCGLMADGFYVSTAGV